VAQDLGYITVGEKIDPNDWRDNPRRSADEIAADVMANLPPCAPGNQCAAATSSFFTTVEAIAVRRSSRWA
jgi:hypothetical protein